MIEEARTSSTVRSIPDNNTTGINIVFDFNAMAPMRIEHATLKLDLWHSYRGDVEIKLTSPTGSVSTLATKEFEDDGVDYIDWVFSSVRHWGESAKGLWTLSIKDLASGDSGTFRSATLTLFGTSAEPPAIVSQTQGPLLLKEGDPLSLDVQATGGGTLYHAWKLNGGALSNTTALFSVPVVNTSYAGSYLVTVSNLGGSDTSDPMDVGVVSRTLPSSTINQGSTLTLTANTGGPGLSYLWQRDGQPIPVSGKGAREKSMPLKVRAWVSGIRD